MPDRLFCKGRHYFFVEFKAKKGKLSIAQDLYIDTLKSLDIPVYVIYELETFKKLIDSYEIQTSPISIRCD